MVNNDSTKKGAVKYLFMLFIQRVIGLLFFITAAGTIFDTRGMVNFALYYGISVAACIVMYNGHQETLSERGKKQSNTKNWDKVLLPIYVLLAYYVIYLVAGLGIRFAWPQLSIDWFYGGILVYLISGAFTIWPIMENKHFESTSRIQSDRSQKVISTGPYRLVRHPGYLGILLWAISVTMIFGTLAVALTAAAIVITITIRTYLEDTMLKKELAGYLDYANIVKYRLIPFIW